MNAWDHPLKLVTLLADGRAYSEQTLLEHLKLSPEALPLAIGTLQSWGVTVRSPTPKIFQLAAALPRFNQAAIRRYSGHDRITLIPVLDSTNQYLLDRRSTLICGDVCIAEYQTAGRGQRGNRWLAPFGTGALFSMYWQMVSPSPALILLSVVMGIVTAEVLHHLGAPGVTVKWPNDLYLQNRKLGGILVETSNSRGQVIPLVIGAGINLLTLPPAVLIPHSHQPIKQPRISLQEAGINIDSDQLIGTTLRAWRAALQQFSQQGAGPFLARWSPPETSSSHTTQSSGS